jgi:hypothetical protein
MFRLSTKYSWSFCCLWLICLAGSLKGVDQPDQTLAGDPSLLITVEHPILLWEPRPAKPPSTFLRVEALGFPRAAKLTYAWRQVQDVMSPIAANMSKGAVATLSAPAAVRTEATFPEWGVYAIRLTVTDAVTQLSVSRNTWVQVWDSRSHIVVDGKPNPLCPAPGIAPPTVRTLSPDPGPFRHPRVLCTDRDWPEIAQRAKEGRIAHKAAETMARNVAATIDDHQAPAGRMTDELAAYAAAHFSGREPDLTAGITAESSEQGPDWSKLRRHLDAYASQLRDACLIAWLGVDPRLPQAQSAVSASGKCRRLARATAALAHVRLRHSWTEQGGFTPKDPLYLEGLDAIGERPGQADLGLAYDFIASWMTAEEAQTTRDTIFAAAGARTTGERVVFFASGIHGRLNRGWEHNGDFCNEFENRIFAALTVEGEESGMTPAVVRTFTTAPKPIDQATNPDHFAYDWMQPAEHDGGGASTVSKPYPEGARWPHARKVNIDNLQREINFHEDGYTSPWGFSINREAYYGFSAWWLWPAALAYARHGGENQFVTGSYYSTVNALLWFSYPGHGENMSDSYHSRIQLVADGHDGGGDYRQSHIILMKYMYPDDPAVDYVYAANAPTLGFSPFHCLLWALDPGIAGKSTILPVMAKDKHLALTKVDPEQGMVITRSGWNEDDLMLAFDTGWPGSGHMHAEKNSFTLCALGRIWSRPPGYHIVWSDYQTGIQIRDPALARDPFSEGFVGQSPARTPKESRYPTCFPTPPGRLIEVKEDPRHLATLMVGDAATAYTYCHGPDPIETTLTRAQFMLPGLFEDLVARGHLPVDLERPLKLVPNYNPVRRAFRSILLVRSVKPYVLVVDDIEKDGQPRDYRIRPANRSSLWLI